MKNKLQEIRWERNLSLRQLSAKSGVSRSVINGLENSEMSNPTVRTALRLANAFGVSVEELFG